MKLSYYPGCALAGTDSASNEAVRAAVVALSHELVEVPDWTCCGSTAVPSHAGASASLVHAALNLARADGDLPLLAPCPSCHLTLRRALEGFDQPVVARALDAAGLPHSAPPRVLSFLDLLGEEEELGGRAETPMKVAAYYGCQSFRPHSPSRTLEEVLTVLGCETVPWDGAERCCGAALALSERGVGRSLVAALTKGAAEAGADCIVTPCPLCLFNLNLFGDVPVLSLGVVAAGALEAEA